MIGPWRLDRVNEDWQMLRVNGDAIEVRDLKWWERLRYWFRLARATRRT